MTPIPRHHRRKIIVKAEAAPDLLDKSPGIYVPTGRLAVLHGVRCMVTMTTATVRIPLAKFIYTPRGEKTQCDGGGLRRLERKAMPESHLAQVGVGVRWGQAGSDFHLQNGLMQFVLLILSLMLTNTHAEALTKLSQSAKVDFKHQHPSYRFTQRPLQGLRDRPHRPDCHGADAPSNMQWQTVADANVKDKWKRKGCGNGRRHKSVASPRPVVG